MTGALQSPPPPPANSVPHRNARRRFAGTEHLRPRLQENRAARSGEDLHGTWAIRKLGRPGLRLPAAQDQGRRSTRSNGRPAAESGSCSDSHKRKGIEAMSSYSCPDCKDGSLEAKVREVDLQLEEGETAEIVGGLVLVTSVGCNNGCSEKAAKPKKKKSAPAAAGGACSKSEAVLAARWPHRAPQTPSSRSTRTREGKARAPD
jgi:hypothetical protein